jgi:GT2 family glycosyltransferase
VIPDVVAAVVNFQSAGLCEGLVRSLLADEFVVDGRPGTLTVVIVDNASRGADARVLERLVGPRVKFVRNVDNVGYALANQEAFHAERGRFHLVINPDCLVPRGMVQALVDAVLAAEGEAVVGPLATMDEEGRVLLPPNELPDPYREHLVQLGRRYPALAAWHARRRSLHAHRYWTARAPLELDMLSGGCFLGARATFERHGLFDGGYPLYYEDTDLFRRLRAGGVRLLHVPAARVTHFFSRSSITRMKAAMARCDYGARRYFRTWFGEAGLRAYATTRARAEAGARDHECPWPLLETPPSATPPTVEVPDVPGVFLEISGNPQFTLAAGLLPDGPGPFSPPAAFYGQLGPGTYWLRAADPRTGECLRAWILRKTG